ncbi:MAG: hypothetical protein AAGD25_16160 [Cyanobacteria bacterium P01_F01_bin.150]
MRSPPAVAIKSTVINASYSPKENLGFTLSWGTKLPINKESLQNSHFEEFAARL